MSRLYIRQTGKASLLSEADLEGLVLHASAFLRHGRVLRQSVGDWQCAQHYDADA